MLASLSFLFATIAFASALALLVSAMIGRRVMEVGRDGVVLAACARCGYTIRGDAPAKCPECGAALDRAGALRGTIRRCTPGEVALASSMFVLVLLGWSLQGIATARDSQAAAGGMVFPNRDLDPRAVAAVLATEPVQLPRGLVEDEGWRLIELHAVLRTLPPRAAEILLRSAREWTVLLPGPLGAAAELRASAMSAWIGKPLSAGRNPADRWQAAAFRAIVASQLCTDPGVAFAWTERMATDLDLELTLVDAGGPGLHVFVTPGNSTDALAYLASAKALRRTMRTERGDEFVDLEQTLDSVVFQSFAGGTLCVYAGTVRAEEVGIDRPDLLIGPRVSVPNLAHLAVELEVGAAASPGSDPLCTIRRLIQPTHLRVARLATADPMKIESRLRAQMQGVVVTLEQTMQRIQWPAGQSSELNGDAIGLTEPLVEMCLHSAGAGGDRAERTRIHLGWSAPSNAFPSWTLPVSADLDAAQFRGSKGASIVITLSQDGIPQALSQMLSIAGPELCFGEPLAGIRAMSPTAAGSRLYTPPPVLAEPVSIEVPVTIQNAQAQP